MYIYRQNLSIYLFIYWRISIRNLLFKLQPLNSFKNENYS